ncbi:TRAP transporter small permease [Haemophilus influenzae]|nr:TRAP transporter small permease [Haemophilus influenzae]
MFYENSKVFRQSIRISFYLSISYYDFSRVFNSVLRYFFDSGIAFSEEFSRICFVYMIFFGIILVAKDKAHLTVDIIISALPEQYRKIVLIVANICVLIAMIFIAYGALQLMSLTYTQQMPATGISSSFYI